MFIHEIKEIVEENKHLPPQRKSDESLKVVLKFLRERSLLLKDGHQRQLTKPHLQGGFC